MREIKFRAWDKKQKRWANLQLSEMEFTRDGLLRVGETIEYGTHAEFNDFELMQYTGLEDKNGKPIYEGDVVQDGRPELRYWIDYKPPAFYLRASRDRAYQVETFRFKDAEVIGNIYEHEHLLTEGR